MQHPEIPEGNVNKIISVAGATQIAEIKYKTFITFDELFCWHSYMPHKHHYWVFFSIKSVHIYPKYPSMETVWFRKKHSFKTQRHFFKLKKLTINFNKTLRNTFVIQLQVLVNVNNLSNWTRGDLYSIAPRLQIMFGKSLFQNFLSETGRNGISLLCLTKK